MKHRIKTKSYFSFCLAILATILSGAISIPLSNEAIAQVSPSDVAQSDQLMRAKEANQGLMRAKEATQGLFDSLIEGDFEQARKNLSPSLKQYTSAADLEEEWQRIIDVNGTFDQYKKIRPTSAFDTYTVLVTAKFQNRVTDFVVTLDSDRQITAVDFLWIGNVQDNAEEFVDAVSSGRYGVARGYLASDLKESILPETLEQQWQEILEATGPFKRRSNSKVVKSYAGSDVVLVNLEFERENRSFMILFNPLSEIVGVDFPKSPD